MLRTLTGQSVTMTSLFNLDFYTQIEQKLRTYTSEKKRKKSLKKTEYDKVSTF